MPMMGFPRLDSTAMFLLWVSCTAADKTCLKPRDENAVFVPNKEIFFANEKLQYECKEGFETIKGTPGGKTHCKNNGWNPNPVCLPIECDTLILVNGRVEKRQDKYLNGDVVHFSCLRGYTRVGPDSAQCYHFGWYPQPPACKAKVKSCEQPSTRIDHGFVDRELHEEYQHGEKVVYECDAGFAMIGSNTIECVDGEWTSLPSCTELCPLPPQLPNAAQMTEGRNYKKVAEVAFKCLENFVLQGPQKIMCDGGRWQTPPRCVDTRCDVPPSIPHGEVESGALRKYSPGEIVEYVCHEGFVFEGQRSAICENAEWSELPSCKAASGKCDHPPVINNGDILESLKYEYNSGESVHYKCQRLYRMDGNAEVSCKDGCWSEPPTCIVPCTASEEDMRINNIQLRWGGQIKLYSESGDTVEFVCKPGYYHDPSSPPLRQQCRDGLFHYPRCLQRI